MGQSRQRGDFIAGGFLPHGFIRDRQVIPDPTVVTRRAVWQDSDGRYWRAAGRLPFGFAPDRWLLASPVSAQEFSHRLWATRLATITGAIATLLLAAAGFAIGWFHAPLWLVIAPLVGAMATAHITAFHAGRSSRRLDHMIVVQKSSNGAS